MFIKLLPSMFLAELDPDTCSFHYRLLGNKVSTYLGFDARGYDANSIASPLDRKALIERELACHNHPVGLVAFHIFLTADNDPSMFETTMLPCWGRNGERLVICHVSALAIPTELVIHNKKFNSYYSIGEIIIDLGNGVPRFVHDYIQPEF